MAQDPRYLIIIIAIITSIVIVLIIAINIIIPGINTIISIITN